MALTIAEDDLFLQLFCTRLGCCINITRCDLHKHFGKHHPQQAENTDVSSYCYYIYYVNILKYRGHQDVFVPQQYLQVCGDPSRSI